MLKNINKQIQSRYSYTKSKNHLQRRQNRHYFKKSLNLHSVHLGFIMVAVTAPIIYLLKYS